MTSALPGVREELEERGYARVPGVFAAETVNALRDALDGWIGTVEPDGPYGILRHNPWKTLADVEAVVRGGPIPALVAELLDEDEVVLFQDNVVWKPPGTSGSVQWHQDYSYWPLDAPDGLTVWIALDDADVENGCVHYVPGTHNEGERRPADFVEGARQAEQPELEPIVVDARREVAPGRARAGDVIVHHPLVWHTSPPNPSPRHRRALSQTWITSRVCWDGAHAPHPYNHELAPDRGSPVEGPDFPRFRRA